MSGWRQRLVKSLYQSRGTPESRYFQLATQSADGMLHNRTVVCRGLDDELDALWLITDTRSQKVSDIQNNPRAAVCWYIAKTREQYRFSVTCEVFTTNNHAQLCQQYWQSLSEQAKTQFLWGKPGQERLNVAETLVAEMPMEATPPAHFCVLRLDIHDVDYLSLRGNPQIREHYDLDGAKWRLNEIIP